MGIEISEKFIIIFIFNKLIKVSCNNSQNDKNVTKINCLSIRIEFKY